MKVAQSCPTLCDLANYPVHGILQARIMERVAAPFSREPSAGPPLTIRFPSQVEGHADLLCACLWVGGWVEILTCILDLFHVLCSDKIYKLVLETMLLQSSFSRVIWKVGVQANPQFGSNEILSYFYNRLFIDYFH